MVRELLCTKCEIRAKRTIISCTIPMPSLIYHTVESLEYLNRRILYSETVH